MRLLAVLASGLLYSLCFPPHAHAVLAWAALVPALVVVRRVRAGSALAYAAGLAVACTCTTVDWLPRAVARYYEQPWAVGLGLFAGITFLMVVPPFVAFAACYRRIARQGGSSVPPLGAAAWVATEYARANLWTGNPWVILGYSQVGQERLAQIADVTGVYGPSFVVAWVNVGLAEWWLARGDRARRRAIGRSLLAAAGVIGLFALYGEVRIATLARATEKTPAVDVAVVQDNLDLGARWQPGMEYGNLRTYLALTHRLLEAGATRLVVWPENAMPFFVERERTYRASIARVLAPRRAELLAGGLHFTGPLDSPLYYNSAFVLSPDGEVVARYDKQHLLPFTEYFPFPRLDLLRRRFARARVLTAGGETSLLPTAAGRAGVVICNEALFPDLARARVREGAQWLVLLTNDTWLADRRFAGIAFEMARLRAVELRRYLVRASTWGPSAIVDPLGRVLALSAVDTRTVLSGTVRPLGGTSLYARLGDVFALACVLAVVIGLGARALRRR
jgi:apolipoprotein N-acyltransferase